MFNGGYAPQIGPEQMREETAMANATVKYWAATAAVLYFSPFVIDAVSGFF
ncbi:mitochondrial outer membrane translocase complex, subunit Tom5 [Xylariaceae sp. FL0804]|nr:mitochondrial outer membrane translocase complex, subunit Tom5 [Xylariaceae sp. FL0804]